MAIRRDVYEKVGGYDPNINWGQEIELCRRISKFGKIFFDPTLKMPTSFRRYSRECENQFFAFFLALKELTVTVFRFFPVTFLGKEMTPQKPVRKKKTHAISKDIIPIKKVSLTFDDGPYGKATKKILNILKEKNVKATFFVLGDNAKKYPDILKMIPGDSHLIGNHSLDHSKFLSLKSKKKYFNNIKKSEEIISSITSLKPCFYRPPWGLRSPDMMRALHSRGYKIILWDIITLDPFFWAGPEIITKKIMRKLKPGSVIVLHDGRDTKIDYPRENVIEALPYIIDGIRAQGYDIVPLDELIGEEAYF